MTLLKRLNLLARGRFYWWLLLALGFLLEAGALVYQHVLDQWPCVVCIHVRMVVLVMMLISVIALLFNRSSPARRVAHVAMTATMVVFVERAWMLFGTERGLIFSSCGMDLGLPAWLALDKWMPFMFEVWASCGYTPEILFGITMAEFLLALSGVLLVVSALFTLVDFTLRKDQTTSEPL